MKLKLIRVLELIAKIVLAVLSLVLILLIITSGGKVKKN